MPSMNQTYNLTRRGFGLKDEVAEELASEYRSNLTKYLRDNGSELTIGDLHLLMAKEFGFCYGVDRAVDYAYETRRKFPDKTIYITSEIIHNPRVNLKLREMDFRFLSGTEADKTYCYDDITKEDVVILPAFGAGVIDMEILTGIGCLLVDTTCGSVMNVWKKVERNAKDHYTSIIHGKYSHEETIATSSRAMQFPGGRYLIVRNEKETKEVCDYILNGGDKQTLLNNFEKAVSPGFDPDKDLVQVGIANQTTMLSSESMAVSQMIQQAMIGRYGDETINSHFRAFDTICSATQERQDAVIELGEKKLDLLIVVGGYNSSNTNHLCEIGLRFAPTYHICEADCLISCTEIHHKPFNQSTEIKSFDWLPNCPVTIGFTSGASTPDKVVEETILRVLEFKNISISDVLPNIVPAT